MTRSNKSSKLRDALGDTLRPRPPAPTKKLDELLKRHANPASAPVISPPATTLPLKSAVPEPDSTTAATPGPPPAHPQPTPGPITPARDFYKRPNSIERDAVAAGVFPGGTKNTYDVLFQRTRGAVVPVRSIQATKRQLMLWADVCNEKTIEAHIKHLCGVGLLKRTGSLGDNKGQFYEVFTPDEIGLETDLGPPPAQAHPRPTPAQNMAPPQAQKLPPGGLGNTIENTGTYGYDKTSFKTNTERDDDEGFAPLFNAAKEIVGREVEPQHWRELAELLAVELKIAAGRTTVSSPAAFLTEHLRRRLWKKEKRQLDAEGAGSAAAAQVGKGDVSQCPDCRGTGMWYPEGFEKGVAKCRHEKLTALSSS